MTLIRFARTAIAAIALIAVGAPALAADRDPPPAADGYSWEGPYLGGHLGYGWLDVSNTSPGQAWSQDDDGFLGGVLVGYNFQMDRYVFGVEADAAFGFIDDTEVRPVFGPVEFTHHGQHTFRVRGGRTYGPALFYATGGLALADFRASSPIGSDKDFFVGFTIGGGAEVMIADRWSLRAEYLYADYGKETLTLGGVPIRSDFETHNLRFGFAYSFGHWLP